MPEEASSGPWQRGHDPGSPRWSHGWTHLAWKQWRWFVQCLTVSARIKLSEQMGHSKRSTLASRCWIWWTRSFKSAIFFRTMLWLAFVVLHPRIAKPVDMRAPAMPSTCDAAAADFPSWSATRTPTAPAPSATALTVRVPSTASSSPRSSSLEQYEEPTELTECALENAPVPEEDVESACRACIHSLSSSETTKAFQASLDSWAFKSVRFTWFAMESPAKARPPAMAEPIPSPTPTGGAAKRSTAEATPRPALAVLPMFTPTHWWVNCLSSSISPVKVIRWMFRSSRAAAHIRFVAQTQLMVGLPSPTPKGAAPSAAARVAGRLSEVGREPWPRQCSHSSCEPCLMAFHARHMWQPCSGPLSSKTASMPYDRSSGFVLIHTSSTS
mmetsp:Transcript_30257/g.85322  ORF Transcript_30257/g.85322 Transcript_30257/m.85322 type:complete len:385 (-) Transcript_30257:410-1564(-)